MSPAPRPERISRPSRGRSHVGLWRCCARLAALYGTIGLAPAFAWPQQSRPSEYQVKAAYLFNFSRFVSWPLRDAASAGGPFAICVMGKDPFGSVLDSTLAGETIEGRNVIARRVTQVEDAAGCRVLFISMSEESRLKDILTGLDRSSILTVSDIAHFAERGGMIQFVLQGDRVRFEVNLASAIGAKLTLSSDLLKVAVAVRKSGLPGA